MPRKTVKMGKKFATHVGSSLSQIVTDLIEHTAGESIPLTISKDQSTYTRLEEKANKAGSDIESLIPALINESLGD